MLANAETFNMKTCDLNCTLLTSKTAASGCSSEPIRALESAGKVVLAEFNYFDVICCARESDISNSATSHMRQVRWSNFDVAVILENSHWL